MQWEAIVILFFIVVRRFLRSLEVHGAAFKPAPPSVFNELADAQYKKKMHHVCLGPAREERASASHCIVLLHGWAQSSSAWLATAEALHARFPRAVIIVPDLVGHGKSSDALAAPEATVTPFTFTVAVLSVTVGVSVTEAVALVTLAV